MGRTLQSAIEEAFAYQREGHFDIAEQIYDQLMQQVSEPEVNILFGYGTTLVCKQKYGLGIKLLEEAVKMLPTFAPLITNLACAYKQCGQDAKALEWYNKALGMAPKSVEVLAGVSGFWINKAQPEKVVNYARKALEHDPEFHAAHMHLAMGLLEQGKFAEAWPHYEHRWETPERVKDKRPYNAPRWDGKSKVKTLSIHGEQGLGDEILFMSLFRKAREHADSIIIECAERLVPIFAESFKVPCYPDHASLIAAEGEPDAYIPMASLPGALGLPDGRPFLHRSSQERRSGRPLVGIAWSGGTLRTNHKDRSLLLESFKPILANKDFDFCSIQYGKDLDAQLNAVGLQAEPNDFMSLHKRIASCSLIISVCQTAVHQAGAMGIPTWCLVPHKAAWRYARPDMRPWYNSVKFFRQDSSEEWGPVIEEVASQLAGVGLAKEIAA